MITLFKFEDGRFLVCSAGDDVYRTGTLDQAIELLRDLDVEDEEIEVAISEFESNDCNRARFGSTGNLIYTDCADSWHSA